MKIIKNLPLFIFLTLSINLSGQSVTFQSFMQTIPWAEQVLLNGNPLTETSTGVFEIPPSNVLPGKNILEFVSLPVTSGHITSADIVLLRKAILELQTLTPGAIIAADIDYSNFVGIGDIVRIINHILGVDSFVPEYKFVHSDFDVSSLDLFDFGIDVDQFCFNQSDLNSINFVFDVFITGDVNLSSMLKPNNNVISETRSGNMIFSLDDISVIAGSSFEIPFSFSAESDIEGLQLAFENKGIIVESIELDSYDHEIHMNNTIEEQTKIVVLSDNASKEIKGTIIGKSMKNAKVSDIISISSDFHDEAVYSNLSLSGISIEYGTTSIDEAFNLDNLVISPNPIQDYFSIQIPTNLLNPSSFTITNTQGQVVMQQEMLNRNVLINRSDLGASGLYVFTWSYGDRSIHKKLIVE